MFNRIYCRDLKYAKTKFYNYAIWAFYIIREKNSMKKCEYVKITIRKKGILNWFDSINIDCLYSVLYSVQGKASSV